MTTHPLGENKNDGNDKTLSSKENFFMKLVKDSFRKKK